MPNDVGDVGDGRNAQNGTLLERESELALIDAVLAGATDGDGRLLLLEGPAGIGKTVLLHEARVRARATGVSAAFAHGSEFEREFPYAVIRQLLEPLVRAAGSGGSRPLLRGAAQFAGPVVLPDAADATAVGDDGFAVVNGLYWLAVNLAEQSPLVLIVDDAHWADLPSLLFLRYLARRLDGVRLSVIASIRSGEADALDAGLLDELDSTPTVLRGAPEALSQAGVAAMLSRLFGRAPDPQFALRCHSVTGGNPLFIQELAKVLVADGVPPDADSRSIVDTAGPEAIARSALRRLERLSADAVALAQSLAVLGRDATLARAAVIAELSDQRALAALDLLVGAGFVDAGAQIQFSHPVIRAAIYRQLPPGRRTVAHRRIAELLNREGAEIDSTGGHLLLSQPTGSDETVAILRRAAAHAFSLGLPAHAATYLTRALQESPARELRATMLFELGMALKMTGGLAGALEHLDQAAELAAHPPTRVRAVIEASTLRVYGGDWQGPLAAIERALSELGGGDLELLLKTEGSLAAIFAFDEHLVARFDERLPELAELAQGSGAAAGPLLMSLAAIGAFRGEPNELTRARVTRAWAGGDFLGASVALELLPQGCWGLLVCDELDAPEPIIAAVHEYASARGSLMAFLMATTLASAWEARRGRLAVAEADLRLACEGVLEHHYLFALPTILWGSVDVLLERPSVADLAALVETVDPAVLANSFNAAIISMVRGRMRFVVGDRDGAIADLRYVGRLCEALRFANPNALPWRSTLALMLAPEAREEALELARAELAATGARPRRLYQSSRDALTPSELRVARLAADGRSTRDIAQALFVTTRTIEAHLQHAYAKLGINSRRQLRDALDRPDGS